MKRLIQCTALALFALLMSVGCAGVPLPWTDYRLMDWPIESRRKEINSSCINLEQLNAVASLLESQHILYLQSRNDSDAILIGDLQDSLGEECRARLVKLTVPKIKTQLFGDIQIITDSYKLRELGGVALPYENVGRKSAIEYTLHLREHSKGPKRLLVAVYRLEDNRVIHFNYSGTNNVDTKSRRWPIDEFLGALVQAAGKAIIP